MKINISKSNIWITLALLGSSVEPLIVKIGLNNQISSFQILVLKLICGAIIFTPFYARLKIHNLSVMKRLFFISAMALVTNYCIFLSLEHLSVPMVVTLITTTPVFVGLLNQLQGRVTLKKEFWVGVLAIIIGVLLSLEFTYSSWSSVTSLGLIFVIMSILGSTIYRTSVEKLCEDIDPLQISAFIFFINGVFSVLMLPWIGKIVPGTWPIALWLGLAGAVANIAFINAIHSLGSTRTSIISLLQRPLVILLATVILKTPLSAWQVTGIALVFFGVRYAKTERNNILALRPVGFENNRMR